jgi:hypothetical protein
MSEKKRAVATTPIYGQLGSVLWSSGAGRVDLRQRKFGRRATLPGGLWEDSDGCFIVAATVYGD